MQFWLSYNNNAERLQLPVNPESIRVRYPHGYDDFTVTNLGDFTVIGDRGAVEISFASFFPRDYNPSYCEYADIPKPYEAIDTILRWKNSRKPIRIIVTGTNINHAVTIRDLEVDELGGNPGDVYFNLSLKEFTFIQVKKVDTSTPTKATVKAAAYTRPDTRENPKSYTVKSGDTLWKMAQKNLGNGDKWREIYNKNKSVIGNNPNVIKVGQVLSL